MSVFVFLINAPPFLKLHIGCASTSAKKAPLASPYHVDVRGAIVLLLLLLLSRCLQSPSPPSEGAVFGIVYKRGM
ncbi:hypothetical protein E2P81_ATG02794 [Venturia nashicola]|nr:hypothetical protein E2P81_ATG02794 [Venturia nashicola]